MRIAIDARYLTGNYSGIGVYSEQLLRHLAILDQENEYFCFVQPDYTRPLELGENFQIIRYNAPPLSLKTIFWLHRALNEIKPDFFHTLFPLMPVFYRGKLLVTVHDLQPLMMKEWTGNRSYPVKKIYDLFYRWMYPATFSRANWLISVSQATKDAISSIMPDLEDKTIVVHSGIEADAVTDPDPEIIENLRQKHDIPGRYILYVGSTRPNKNVPNMIKAFAEMKKNNPGLDDVCFVLVLSKDRFMSDIVQVVKTLKVESGIRYLEAVSHEEKQALYHSAELLFFATKFEGFGFPVLEAQAQNTPVVASDNHSLPEIAGESAVIIDPDNINEMSNALLHIIKDESFRKSLIEMGQKNILKFSWDKTAGKILEIYRHLI
jgi:glycosyltransferase involved in cell wall biosynthesis